jgi:hypothetical protein
LYFNFSLLNRVDGEQNCINNRGGDGIGKQTAYELADKNVTAICRTEIKNRSLKHRRIFPILQATTILELLQPTYLRKE